MSKEKRRRVSKQDVVDNARRGGGGQDFLRVPKGVRIWAPKKAGTQIIDIIPYEVKSDNHPDKIKAGLIWYKLPFNVHRGVGPGQEDLVCPASVGKPCPICQERAKLAKNYEANEDAIKPLNAQKWVAYNIMDPEDKDKVAILLMSRGKFARALEKELTEDDTKANFYDVTDEGHTLKVRFSDAEYEGRNFIEATRIDFNQRKELDEDEILDKTVALEECLNIMDFDSLKRLFLQIDDDDNDKGQGADDGGEKDKPDKKKPKAEEKDPDDDEEEDESDKKDGGKKPKFKEGDTVTFENAKGKAIIGKITDIDDDEITVEDSDGDEHDVDIDDIELTKPKKEKSEQTASAATEGKGGKPATSKLEVGDSIVDEDGLEGVVTNINLEDDEVTVKAKDKISHIIDIDDIETIIKKKDKAGGAPKFEAGDEVIYGDDEDEFEIVKVHSSGEKVKIKDDNDNEKWVPIEEVKAKG